MVATACVQASCSAVVARQPRGRVVRVAAVQQQSQAAPAPAPLRFLAAGLAAAAVATCGSPAEAGVVLVQPEVKNFVTDSAPAPSKAAPGEAKKAAPAPKKKAEPKEEGSTGAGFEAFRPLVFPLSLVFVGGAGVALTKADPEFAKLLDESWGAKDSNAIGAGYETAPGLKDTPFFGGSNTGGVAKAAPKKAGTTKKAASGTAKKSIFG